MKKFIFTLLFFTLSSTAMFAQDDMYFTPKKKTNVESGRVEQLSYDDNSDIIDFEIGEGVYPDFLSLSDIDEPDSLWMTSGFDEDNEFTYTKRMGRFDDFYGYYAPYLFDYYHSPYFYTNYYGWYDPWAYRWEYNWYYPWYDYYWGIGGFYGWPYSYYGWGYPYNYGYYGWGNYYGHHYYGGGSWAFRGHTGTGNHWGNGRQNRDQRNSITTTNRKGTFIGARGNASSSTVSGTSRGTVERKNNGYKTGGSMRRSGNLNSNRQNNNNTRQNNRDFDAINRGPSSMGSYNSHSSSVSPSRSGGFSGNSGGGNRSGSGGHFGGRR